MDIISVVVALHRSPGSSWPPDALQNIKNVTSGQSVWPLHTPLQSMWPLKKFKRKGNIVFLISGAE